MNEFQTNRAARSMPGRSRRKHTGHIDRCERGAPDHYWVTRSFRQCQSGLILSIDISASPRRAAREESGRRYAHNTYISFHFYSRAVDSTMRIGWYWSNFAWFQRDHIYPAFWWYRVLFDDLYILNAPRGTTMKRVWWILSVVLSSAHEEPQRRRELWACESAYRDASTGKHRALMDYGHRCPMYTFRSAASSRRASSRDATYARQLVFVLIYSYSPQNMGVMDTTGRRGYANYILPPPPSFRHHYYI